MLPLHRPYFLSNPCATVLDPDPLPHAKPGAIIVTSFRASSSHVYLHNIHSTGWAALNVLGLGPQPFACRGNLSQGCFKWWHLLGCTVFDSACPAL